MARYKNYSYEQGIMIPVDFTKQILPGTIEHTIHWIVDQKIDLNGINVKYNNDKTGAPAYFLSCLHTFCHACVLSVMPAYFLSSMLKVKLRPDFFSNSRIFFPFFLHAVHCLSICTAHYSLTYSKSIQSPF